MSFVQSNLYIEALQEQGDYDTLQKTNEVFGFFSFDTKQKWSILQIFKRQEKIQSLVSIEDQEKVNEQKNFYERLQLIDCQVNVFAMKKVIKNNSKSLRDIIIKRCNFYLSDQDALQRKNQVKNKRMLQEIGFIWMIQQFKFEDITTIDIELSKDPCQEEVSNLKNSQKFKLTQVLAQNDTQEFQQNASSLIFQPKVEQEQPMTEEQIII